MEEKRNLVEWLLEGDPAIRYQTKRDLLECLDRETTRMESEIALNGWGKRILDLRDPETKLWGNGMYSPKWISTHYSLLQLKDMGLAPTNPVFAESGGLLLDSEWQDKPWKKGWYPDVCVVAMTLSICCYAKLNLPKINECIDYILEKQFPDGGWNCSWDRGAEKSSVHTTLSVLEAFRDYRVYGYTYRLEEIKAAVPRGEEFLLRKHLFRSEHDGEIIDKKFLMLSYPCRWMYDILRCLDYFQSVRRSYDPRMEEALNIVIAKRRKDGFWPVQHKHAGRVHFDMEKTGEASRWNTLRVLRVLKLYKPEECQKAVGN